MGRLLLLLTYCVLYNTSYSFAKGDENIGKTKLQFGFIENKGQIINQNNQPAKEVLYLLNTPGLNVQLRKGGFSYDTYITEGEKLNEPLQPATATNQKMPERLRKFHRVDISMEGANPN